MSNQIVTAKAYLEASKIDTKVPPRIVISYVYSLGLAFVNEMGYVKETGWNRGELYVNEDKTIGILLKIGIGAPVLSMSLHELKELGMKECIIAGVAGSLKTEIKTGDILKITSAFACDGVSTHYGLDQGFEYKPKQIIEFDNNNFPQGVVVSMSAPYKEDSEFIKEFSKKADCVDMETSALFTIGDYLGISTTSVLVINDLITENGWIFSKDNSKTKTSFTHILREVTSG